MIINMTPKNIESLIEKTSKMANIMPADLIAVYQAAGRDYNMMYPSPYGTHTVMTESEYRYVMLLKYIYNKTGVFP